MCLAGCDPSAHADSVIAHLRGYRYTCVTERALQDGLEAALISAQESFVREPILSPSDRPDFMLDCGIVIEVKIKGSFAQLLRQCARYCKDPAVLAIIVIGTPYWIPTLPPEVGGKPLYFLRLTESLL